ncbi:type VI secretion system lipoprotein TssJ [Burkholderia sp. 22PA0099]|uniref:type VI secretion system lipoprotein TssJ n=1 Tax=Burkholderia sp. 22PA0099 TaxID=3237372 RepID=UPI0039C28133
MQHEHHLTTPIQRNLLLAGAILALVATAGCGMGQAVANNTVEAAKWVFTTRVRTMNIDLVARSALNTSDTGQPLSTVVRLYQLKDARAFNQLDYVQLQTNDLAALKADVLATKDVVLRPGASVSLSEPMHEDARVVGVVAFFREPGHGAVWKLTVPKQQWKKTDPIKIEVRDNMLALAGADQAPVTRASPKQSLPVTRERSPVAGKQAGVDGEG